MLSLGLLGSAILILAALFLIHFFYAEWRFAKLNEKHQAMADAYGILDQHNLRLTETVAALARYQGLAYPPKEKVTPAVPEKIIPAKPEKRVFVFEKVKK